MWFGDEQDLDHLKYNTFLTMNSGNVKENLDFIKNLEEEVKSQATCPVALLCLKLVSIKHHDSKKDPKKYFHLVVSIKEKTNLETLMSHPSDIMSSNRKKPISLLYGLTIIQNRTTIIVDYYEDQEKKVKSTELLVTAEIPLDFDEIFWNNPKEANKKLFKYVPTQTINCDYTTQHSGGKIELFYSLRLIDWSFDSYFYQNYDDSNDTFGNIYEYNILKHIQQSIFEPLGIPSTNPSLLTLTREKRHISQSFSSHKGSTWKKKLSAKMNTSSTLTDIDELE